MSEEPSVSTQLPAPRWLSRSEKAEFRRIELQRSLAGNPLSATEVDAVADLVNCRSRVADLRRLYRAAMSEFRESPYGANARDVMAAARQIDATTANVQRMARRLGLGHGEAGK